MAVVAVVKYNGGPDVLAWRFPSEGLGTWTKLIVNESQEAVLFADGQALDIFEAGQHELSTNNIPLLSERLNLPAGERLPLAADVWYVNKEYSLEVKWGTPAPIQVQDPKYNAPIPLRALGQFRVQVGESTAFLNQLVAAVPALDNDTIVKHFRPLCLDRLQDNILSFLEAKEISVLEIATHLDELSKHLKDKLMPVLDGLGVKLSDFRVNNIKLSEDNPVVKQINAALARKDDALAKQVVIDLVGSEYVQKQPVEKPEEPLPVPEPPTPIVNATAAAEYTASIPVPVAPVTVMPEPEDEQTFNNNVRIIKTCPVCYNDMEDETGVCKECGYDPKGSGTKSSIKAATEPTEAEPIATKKCPECGNSIEATARFCSTCGYDTKATNTVAARPEPIEPRIAEPKPTVRKCSNCGAQLRDNQKFCHKCGSKP